MIRFLLRKLVVIAIVLIGVNAVTHILTNARASTFEYVERGRAPDMVSIHVLARSYRNYVDDVREGNFGQIGTGRDVTEVIGEAIPASLILLGLAILVAVVSGVTTGVLSVNAHQQRVNPLATMVSLGGFSMPSFYMGIVALGILIWLSVIRGQSWIFLPISGYGLDEHLILPVLVLAARPGAEISRYTAELIAEELPKNYVRTARAKGLSWRLTIIRHAFANVVSTIATTIGGSMTYVLSSLIVVEFLFHWPGIGRLLVLSIWDTTNPRSGFMFDPELAAATMTLVALIYLLIRLVLELVSHTLDPRTRRFQSI